ncbi:MAG TPA: radical SAM protein [Thermoanaerobaculia bacterium]|nr:radical SAM protein [Thermoanaerobaculia bacterium]
MNAPTLSARGVSSLAIDATASADELEPEQALARALELAGVTEPLPRPQVATTRNRTITRRGVLWLGQTCNLRCYFCYFLDRIESREHPEHPFMSLDKAKEICKTLVDVYGNNAIDIQGGEPTIWYAILDLVRYCHEIGLEPTLITNALVLENLDKCKAYKEAGIRDFLVSVHGLGEVHDRVVQLSGAHVRQMKALANLRKVGIPYRFNCVLSKPVVSQLPQIAELAVKTGALVVNFLAFNPFEDQGNGGRRSSNNVPRYSELRDSLNRALDVLDAAGVEANVRYYPLCMVEERHRKSMYNFQQLSYDHHEWDYASWSWTGQQPQRMKQGPVSPTLPLTGQRLAWKTRRMREGIARLRVVGPAFLRAEKTIGRLGDRMRGRDALYRENARVRSELHCGYVYSSECQRCDLKAICDGFHGDYAAMFGTGEAVAVHCGGKVADPLHFIAAQDKIVENGAP